ncbi:MAG: BREX-1 system phosphatase PglZ type B, partial [Lentisphaeria bacterium]|nr:BREX-1 system phosphatase PglZ type B [Lentisphaeria bacterium]
AGAYLSCGWRADDAVVRALACVAASEDCAAVTEAVRAIYLPWAEDSARYLQKVVERDGYPLKRETRAPTAPARPGECVLFVDGLRFDLARRLSEKLVAKNLGVEETPVWAALPSVTATGKPAVTPLAHLIVGQEANADFEPCVAATGQSLQGGYHLQKLLADAGWHVPEKSQDLLPQGPVWCEFGNIDHEGHDRGWKLASHLETMLDEIADQVEDWLAKGCGTVRVVTDHGWLLMPGGLPKAELPSFLTENQWGRCAALKPGASTEERLYPWFWNVHQEFALADGISCYRAGMEYAHGGLSLQECLTLHLVVSASAGGRTAMVQIADVSWKGLRCKVAAEGQVAGLSLDLRTQPGNPSSSVVMGVKPFKDDGTCSVVVENEELEGQEIAIVIMDDSGQLAVEGRTVIGKEGG